MTVTKPSKATKAIYVKSVAVTYTSGGTSTLTDNNLALTGDPVALSFDLYNNATAQVINYTTSSTGEVTVADNDYATFVVDQTNKTITVTPTAETPSTQTITVNQAADDTYKAGSVTFTINVTNSNPAVNNISDITATGTYKVRGTIVAKSQRGFIVGDGTGYVYYYNSSYDQTAYNIGDMVELSGSVVVYGGVYEFNNTTTVTPATSSNYVAETPTVLSGADMDARVASTTPAQLSNYVQYEGTLTVSGTYYNITSIEGASTAKGSISYPLNTDFTSLDGKKVKVTGYYVGVSSSQYYNTMIGSVEEIVATTPSITLPAGYQFEVNADGGDNELPVTCSNLAADPQLAVVFCEADGETPATYDWISATINTDGNIDGEILANTGEARTAYFYVTGKDANGNTVNSNLVTFTQNGASIEVTGSLDFTAEGQSKTVNIDFGGLENPTFEVNFFEADGTTSATYDWVSTAITSENKIDLTIEANTGAARTAYFKVQDTTSGLSSELVTINQEAYVAPATGDSYELYTGALTEGDYIIYYDGKAMNTTVSSDRLQYAEIEPNSDVITTSDASIVWHIAPSGEYWTIYNADANAYAASTGAKNKAQMLEDGTDDKALWTVSGTETYEFVNKQNTSNSVNANLRNNAAYGFACYGTSTGGALSLYKKVVNSTEPSIKVNPKNVDATSAETEGTITVTYVNFEPADKEIQTVAADGETSATYGWLITDFDATTGNIEYLIGENTATEARTAYLKVYALDDEANDVYSELITINQAAYVAPAPAGVWVKTDLADLTSSDVFVIVGNDGYNNAMTNDNGTSNAPAAVEVTVTGDMITSNVADNMKWNISGNATDGYTFYPNGDSEKWLYCTNTNNGVRVGTNENKNFTVSKEGYLVNSATSRYIGVYTDTSGSDWRCYTTINNNIKDQTFSFYKFTDHLSVTVGTVGYATLYYGETNLVVPEGVEAYTYKVTDGKLDESYLYEANEVIPAGTGVVLKANAGEYKFVVTTEVGLEDPDNLLRGSDVAVTTEGPAAGDYLFYLLGVVDSKVGFYWGKEDGAAFTSGAHKAYLAVPAEQAAGVRGFTFDGTTVGISTIGVQMPEGEAYDLQGRRVQQFQKGGLYIVGGKKLLAK